MTIEIYLGIFACFVLIVGGLIHILNSAKKFKLDDEQLKKIKQREKEQRVKDEENK